MTDVYGEDCKRNCLWSFEAILALLSLLAVSLFPGFSSCLAFCLLFHARACSFATGSLYPYLRYELDRCRSGLELRAL